MGKLVHHVELHPNYDDTGSHMQGYQVHVHHADGSKPEITMVPEVGKAVQYAHQCLLGHEQNYEAEVKEEAEAKNGEQPDQGPNSQRPSITDIAGVPRRASTAPVRNAY